MGQLRDASKSLRPLLNVLVEVVAAAQREIAEMGQTTVGYPSFDRTVLTRGLNILVAVRALSDGLHWEAAASSARQLFELILNMEALAAMPSREDGALQFGLYALMQKAKMRNVEDDYNREVGHPIDETKAAETKALLEGPTFETFKERTKPDGTIVWKKSWTGKTPWDLAVESPNPNRVAQYRQLFVAWSEESHAAPVALMDAMMRTGGPNWAEEYLHNELREMTQILLMVIHQFLELWSLLVNVPPIDFAAWARWFRRINAFIDDEWDVRMDIPELEKRLTAVDDVD
jgi:hypothetical protein